MASLPGVEDPSIVGAEGGTGYPVQSTMGQPQSVQIQSGTEARSFWQPTDFRITNVDHDVMSTASMGTIAGINHRASAGVALERLRAFVSRDDTIPIVDCGVLRSHVPPEWSMPSSMRDRSVRTSVFHRPRSVGTLRADEEVSALSGRALPCPVPTHPLVERCIPPPCPSRPVSRGSRASQDHVHLRCLNRLVQ